MTPSPRWRVGLLVALSTVATAAPVPEKEEMGGAGTGQLTPAKRKAEAATIDGLLHLSKQEGYHII